MSRRFPLAITAVALGWLAGSGQAADPVGPGPGVRLVAVAPAPDSLSMTPQTCTACQQGNLSLYQGDDSQDVGGHIVAGAGFYLPVSYTHLTLPTNREV